MKTEFKSKFLQHMLEKKRNNEGFTLIELLVVIIIVGILAAIALPSFLNQASKARQSEAKSNIGALNSAQQAFYAEKQQFAGSLSTLAAGVPGSTTNYTYETTGSLSKATSKQAALRGYSGAVVATNNTTTGETIFSTIICESASASNGAASTLAANGTSCPSGESRVE